MNALDQDHGGVSPELEHECSTLLDGGFCATLGVLCPNWLALEPESVSAAKDADEWPFDDDPPDPL
jgi:hypothetical protein